MIKVSDYFNKFDLDKLPKITNCIVHGNGVKSRINGTCLACFDEKEQLVIQKRKNKIRTELIQKSNIKALYADANFENYKIQNEKQSKLIQSLVNYKGNSNLILLGKTGTGKTHLACSIIKNYINNYYDFDLVDLNKINESPCYYVKYYNLASLKINDYKKYLNIIGKKILIIDEVANAITDFKMGLLFEIIDQRYDDMLNTVLISNLSPEKFKESLPTAIYSRIKSNYLIYDCDWEDYRINNGIKK